MLDQPTDNFFLTDEHATAAIFTETTSSKVTNVNVIFNNDFVGIEAGGTVVVESADPVLYYESSKISGISYGDTFEFNSLTYLVRGIEPDGTGVTLVRLEKQ